MFGKCRKFPEFIKEISKNYLIFLDLRVIVAFGSIKVEQRVDESPLFLIENQ